MGFIDRLGFGRLRDGLAKTRESIVGKVRRLVSSKGPIDDEVLERLEEILISGDVGVGTTDDIIGAIRRRVREEGTPEDLVSLLKEEVERQFAGAGEEVSVGPGSGGAHAPYVIMVVGINGVGKTTTIGKLAHRYVQSGRRVTIGAADTFRAAANEQLEIWAKRAGAELIRQQHGADPAAVAFDTVSSAKAHSADIAIIDTAGRLHTKVNLMAELKKIRTVIGKLDPSAPHEVLLVIDASTGQNGLQQAKQFADAVGVTGIVLTKLDGTAKGGVVLSIGRELRIPVRFIGVGESREDLQPFDRKAFVEALFTTDDIGPDGPKGMS